MRRRVSAVLLLLAFIVAALLIRAAIGDRFEPKALLAMLREAGDSTYAVPLFFVLFGATYALVPAAALVVVAGATWGFWPGWLIGWVVANIWAHVQFFVGRWLGRDRLKEWLARKGFARVLRELEHGGVVATMVIRQFPLPFVGVNTAAGASPIAFRRWALGNALGLLPGALVYSSFASAIVDGVEGAQSGAVIRVVASGLSLIALGLVSRLLLSRRRTT